MTRAITLKIRPNLAAHTRRRALSGIGSMVAVHAPNPSPAQIVDALGGIRAACRASGIGFDTVYRLLQYGGGTIASYKKLAEAADFRVVLTEGKSARWKTLHASKDMTWQTPPEVWQNVLSRLGIQQFDLDPCSPDDGQRSIPCVNRYALADDGLSRSWGDSGSVVWVNPPYGKALSLWIDKMVAEAILGVKVIALVPARTGTNWWHKALEGGGKPEFLRGRLRFVGQDGKAGNAAPFDSALIWWV